MTSFFTDLEPWAQSLSTYALSLAAFTSIIDDVATKTSPAIRADYQESLRIVQSKIDSKNTHKNVVASLLSYMAGLESARRILDKSTASVMETDLLAQASKRMSRTFTECAKQKITKLRRAKMLAAQISDTTTKLVGMWAVKLADKTTPQDASKYYGEYPSAQGSALYAELLRIWLARGVDVSKQIENAKNGALALPPDTTSPESLKSRESLHPIQAMGITFGFVNGPRVTNDEVKGSAVVIDATLPQATTAIRYDLSPLINPNAAPRATVVTGLNYLLMKRLVTIAEDPVRRIRPVAKIQVNAGRSSRVVRTIDGGMTFNEMLPHAKATNFATVGAGPKPRALRLGELLQSATFGNEVGGIRAFEGPEDLLEEYSVWVGSVSPLFAADGLVERLVVDFTKEYSLDPPKTVADFQAAALGNQEDRDPYRTYIAKSIATVSKRGAETRMLRLEIARVAGAASLYGSHAAAVRGSRRELLITIMSEMRASILAAKRQLAWAYDNLDGTSKTQSIFMEPHAVRKIRLLAFYRALVTEAFIPKQNSQLVEKLETVVPIASLKEYALTKNDKFIASKPVS